MTGWQDYISSFHRERAGVTERLLIRARNEGTDPYAWLASAVDPAPRVIDIGSGSAPMAQHLAGWIGLDRSSEELAVARAAGRLPVIQADAGALPFRSGSAAVVVAAMSFQVLEPISLVVAEAARVLAPGGQLALLLPASAPLPLLDAVRYAVLQVRLRQRIRYPNDAHLGAKPLGALAAAYGMVVEQDSARAFSLPMRTRNDAVEFVHSLYLPGVGPKRIERGVESVAARIGSTLVIPLRRVVLRRSD